LPVLFADADALQTVLSPELRRQEFLQLALANASVLLATRVHGDYERAVRAHPTLHIARIRLAQLRRNPVEATAIYHSIEILIEYSGLCDIDDVEVQVLSFVMGALRPADGDGRDIDA
jgi:hypothetical protein